MCWHIGSPAARFLYDSLHLICFAASVRVLSPFLRCLVPILVSSLLFLANPRLFRAYDAWHTSTECVNRFFQRIRGTYFYRLGSICFNLKHWCSSCLLGKFLPCQVNRPIPLARLFCLELRHVWCFSQAMLEEFAGGLENFYLVPQGATFKKLRLGAQMLVNPTSRLQRSWNM